MVVINKSGMPLPIPELQRVLPSDGKQYVLPYEIAIKYKGYLTPVQMSDDVRLQPNPISEVKSKPVQPQIKETIEDINTYEEPEDVKQPDLEPISVEEIDETDNTIKDERVVRPNSKKGKPLAGKKLTKAVRKRATTKRS